jgi:hypothetical protein
MFVAIQLFLLRFNTLAAKQLLMELELRQVGQQ